MRLKRILEDQKELNDARSLNKLLQSEYRHQSENLLFRKDQTKVENWKEKDIRKDRKPMDTDDKIDLIVNVLEDTFAEEHFGKDVPKRKESKFALTKSKKDRLSLYPGTRYICFSHQNAKVYSLTQDSFTAYFDPAINFLKSAIRRYKKDLNSGLLKSEGVPDVIIEFMEVVLKDDPVRVKKFMKENWKELFDKVPKSLSHDYNNMSTNGLIDDLTNVLSKIDSYFRNMKEGIVRDSGEVIFDGPSYLIVEIDFFQEYFGWDGNEWGVREMYKK